MTTLWVLGAPDPEMEAIEGLLGEAGETVAYATVGGSRVHPGNAYKADPIDPPPGVRYVVLVECDVEIPGGVGVARVDHHRPGDPGYGRAPEEFMPASSIGQAVQLLAGTDSLPAEWVRTRRSPELPVGPFYLGGRRPDGTGGYWPSLAVPPARLAHWLDVRWFAVEAGVGVRIPRRLALIAAADHCPGAAYQGGCPGVCPKELGEHRARTRAEFQGRSVFDVLADIEDAVAVLEAAPKVTLGGVDVADLREIGTVPELPEAACRSGRAVLYRVTAPDGREKVGLLGAGRGTMAGSAPVEAFLGGWATSNKLVDLYGDPARGYAGGYLP